MKRAIAFLAALAFFVSLMFMSAGGQAARAEEPDPIPPAADSRSKGNGGHSPTPSATPTSTPTPEPTSTAKPVSRYFSYEKRCGAKPPQLYIHLTNDSPELEVRYGGNLEQLQAGNEYWIDYRGGKLTVIVNVRWDEGNAVTIVMECPTPTPTITPTRTPTTSPPPTPSETPTPPVLKGKLIVETSCERVSIDVRDVPDGVSHQVKLDGKPVSYDRGAIKVTPGAHVITLVVDGKVVDTVKVAIKACAPAPKKVTLKLQVDKYSTKTSKLRSKAAGYDNDGKLRKGEDKAHYGKSVWEIVTVTGTTETTKAEWIAKINAATKKVPNLKSTRHWTVKAIKKAKAKSITVAWIISGDGKPKAWPKTKVPQRFFATNRR